MVQDITYGSEGDGRLEIPGVGQARRLGMILKMEKSTFGIGITMYRRDGVWIKLYASGQR